MRIKRYFAEDMRTAMRQVREYQGADAVILSNKRVEGGIEIVAATDYEPELVNLSTPSKKSSPMAEYEKVQQAADDAVDDEDVSQEEEHQEQTSEEKVDHSPVVWSQEPTMVKMREEIAEVKQLLQDQLAGLTWNHIDRQQPHRIKLLRDLTGLGLDPQLTKKIVEQIPESTSPTKVWRNALALLAKQLDFANQDLTDSGGVFAIVGTTGVGKTTTVAKLAARFALTHGADKVGLITTDGFRIGAQEQLLTFGRILGVPIQAISKPDQLCDALEQFSDRDLILIDTTGVGQRDKALVESLEALESKDIDVTVLLALSASTQVSTLYDSIRCFRQVTNIHGCVVTKLDEATSLGGLFSAVTRYGLPINYLTTGQCVPEDIKCADGECANLVSMAVSLMKQHAEAMDDEYMASEFTKVAVNG
ncbi:MAG: flagellar biosynthesis protein FlhF [Pseudomonadota bacterium]